MNILKVYIIALFFLFSSISKIRSADYFTDRGSSWFGGNFIYAYMNSPRDKLNRIVFSPLVRYFPLKYFTIGPKFQWTCLINKSITGSFLNTTTEKEFINFLDFGLDLGFAYGKDVPVIPYIIISPLFDVMFDHMIIEEDELDYYDKEIGFSLNASIGFFIKLFNNLALQIAPNYRLSTNFKPIHTFSVTIGFGYIGKKNSFSFGYGF